MKTRNGFVSNSSSSSFIIAFDDTSICETCGCNAISEKFEEITLWSEWIKDGNLTGYYFDDFKFNQFNTFKEFLQYQKENNYYYEGWKDDINEMKKQYKQKFGKKQCKTFYITMNNNMPLNDMLTDFCKKHENKIFVIYGGW